MKKGILALSLMVTGGLIATALYSFTVKDTTAYAPDQHPKVNVERDYTEKLSIQNSGLIMVDFLTGFDPGLNTIPKAVFNQNATALAKMSNLFNLPTIMLGEEGGFRGKFYPLVGEYLSKATRVERHVPSAWDEPKFQEAVKKMGRKKLIVGGISLDICTQLLTIDLLRAGYDVYVVTDCSGSDQNIAELAAMMRMTQAGAVMVTWGTLASELMKDWQSPYGAAVGKLYQENASWGAFRTYPDEKK
ncbi:MAG: isochorismatase family protein [Rhizobacter sp.]|nr:isochorismatase family protein [Ferruginibacter sp.]